jgi:AraC family transcriptional activator of pobA
LIALSRVAADYTGSLRQHGEPALVQVFEVIEHHYAEPLSTSGVAAAVGLSPGHLTTLVRQRTGRTVGEWITERRMAAARDLLASSSLSVEQVAARVGFPDPAYFSRRFRTLHAAPPGAWRATARR